MAPYQRTTRDEYEIQGYYAQGWEVVTCEETLKAARQRLKEYRANESGISFKIVKRRIKIAAGC